MNALRPVLGLVLAISLCAAPACWAKSQEAVAVYVAVDGQRLTARFDIPGKTVRLLLPDGKTLILPVALSGSGARYSNGVMTFWEHQGDAILERGDTLLFEGRIVEPPVPAAAR